MLGIETDIHFNFLMNAYCMNLYKALSETKSVCAKDSLKIKNNRVSNDDSYSLWFVC